MGSTPNTLMLDSTFEAIEEITSDNDHVWVRARRKDDGTPWILEMTGRELPSSREIALLRHEHEILEELAAVPGVLHSQGLVRVGRRWALAFPSVAGHPLRDALRRGRLSLKTAIRVVVSVCEILAAVHEKGVVHKDIHPDHILYDPTTGSVHLFHFGLAGRIGAKLADGVAAQSLEGTLAYVSPEQTGRTGRPIGRTSDLYSLGVTMYELLTGTLPFTSADPLHLVHSHIARTPTPPHELDTDIPKVVSAIVSKLLAKEADARYQSASGLAADLVECLLELDERGEIQPFPLGQHDRRRTWTGAQRLYGRAREIEALREAFGRASRKGAELVLVAGYAGIGKSALVQELYPEVALAHGYFVAGKCDQYNRNQPFSAVSQALRDLLRQVMAERPAEVEALGQSLAAVLGANAALVVPLLPELEGILGPQPAVLELGPSESQNRFDQVLQALLSVFCRPEHPVSIFLDDLQWADAASIRLLRLWLTDPGRSHLLLMGAYREQEVDAAHPLRQTLDALRRDGARVTEIHLGSLSSADVTSLLADGLECSPDAVSRLAEHVTQKTLGNPFFVNQLVVAMIHDQDLAWNEAAGAWQWDLEKISARGVSDDVAVLVAAELGRLPRETLRVLRLAACIGHQFDLGALSLVAELSPAELAVALRSAVQAGFVQTLDSRDTSAHEESRYRFLHDRIQQGAYLLIPASDRPRTHLDIGRALRGRGGLDAKGALFSVVGHLNRAATLLESAEEKVDLARLDLAAGRNAKASTAYAYAVELLRAGLGLLPEDAWGTEYTLTRDLHAECAESEYLAGHFDAAEALFAECLRRAQDDVERAGLESVRLKLYQVAGRYAEGVTLATAALRRFGVDLPETAEDANAQIAGEIEQIHTGMAGRSIEDLLSAPRMVDPRDRAVLTLLADCAPCAYIGRPALFPLVTLRMLNFSLRHGNAEPSCFAYSVYGLMLVAVFGDTPSGVRFSEMSLRLNEKMGDKRLRGTLLHLHGDHIQFWQRHMREDLPVLESAFTACQEVGDAVYAGFLAFEAPWQHYEIGTPLPDLFRICEGFVTFAKRTNNRPIELTIKLEEQYFRALIGSDVTSMSPAFDEANALAQIHAASFGCGIAFHHILRLFQLYTFGRPAEALAELEHIRPVLGAVMAMPIEATLALYVALAHLALGGEEHLEAARKEEERLAAWATHGRDNFRHKWLLVRAERARVEGRREDAIALFDEAIDEAQRGAFLQYEALGHELAAGCLTQLGSGRAASVYVAEAIDAYERWGANAKVAELRARFGEVARWQRSSQPAGSLRFPSDTGGLDIQALLRASSAISSELHLEHALDRVMRTILACAGAQRGALVLEREGALRLEALASLEPDEVRVKLEAPLETRNDLPQSIIRYTVRLGELLLLTDPAIDPRFCDDPYLRRRAPRSLLCLVLKQRGRRFGVLVLEHFEARDAFPAERAELVQILSAQAAGALENALLYATLEDKTRELAAHGKLLAREVEERTAELRAANARTVEQAEVLRAQSERLERELAERAEAERAREALHLKILRAQEDRLAELSTPLIPLTKGVLVMPIIGSVDAARAQQILEAALAGAHASSARLVLLDLTGLRCVDASVVSTVVETARALALLGTETVLTGIRGEVAKVLVGLDADFRGITTRSSLESGIEHALRRTGATFGR
ncbi:AAA family ATPase [Polyangium jinanense]|uniref:AAA family ATPase n=1 Tax=Polyangium jinanense TaxID=2829994 RepID=A0A9X3XDN6_9BACT|nr:AAA family ATPase [Polyangium jinanense]MDC3958994.1 AAA family ATPase [Polyangium jinanense]MDC3986381.1 AAA family ATPase [Polyangium jinanense]MDC3988469.1 AAA family ATPase [Polyangium jinanense]